MPAPITEPVAARLRRIQSSLGVRADGVLGPETLTAIEARLRIAPTFATTSLECSKVGLDLIVAFEISSKANYEKNYRRPSWPGGRSGVTIGIGYDLGVTSKRQIAADWSGRVSDIELAGLLAVQGMTGPEARTLARSLSHIFIPYTVAERVFYQITLPRYARLTRTSFPGVQSLPPDAQAMMVSLVYNRGASVSGSSRREMAAIKSLIGRAPTELDAIAEQFESMQRLWPELAGLRRRRRREAQVIRGSVRTYEDRELIRL